MKKKEQNFFDQMKNHRTEELERQGIIALTFLVVSLFMFLLSVELILFGIIKLGTFSNYLIALTFIFFLACFLVFTIVAFNKNSYSFKNGNMASGAKNFSWCGVAVIITLVIMYFTAKDSELRSFIASLFAPITTILAAVLAIMGVHYTHSKQQKNINDKNNLIFIIDGEVDYQIDVHDDSDREIINVCLKNASDNCGYFVGLYRMLGCDVYKINNGTLYQPILPNKSYLFTNVGGCLYDEDITIVYKDISDNYYYICLDCLDKNNIKIKAVDKCDFNFLEERVCDTEEAENKVNNKREPQPEAVDNDRAIDEFKIKQRKEETKPKRTKVVNGYALIVDDKGKFITDTELLTVLKNERAKLARENNVRAYMIFNNQQLVALATYKPKNREEFISLYGLGQIKYELYGERMISLIKETESKNNTSNS